MFTEERALWLYEHYRWLEEHLPRRNTPDARVIVPTKEFFPDRYANDHASAQQVFLRVKEIMGMSEWACRLVPRSDSQKEFGSVLGASGVFGESSHAGAAGTFSTSDEVVITYAEDLVRDPISLVAVFAHELGHYLLATIEDEPPCTWKELEPLTDLTAVVEGFGVFLCNSAFGFAQWTSVSQQGWSWRKQGYLTEAELGFALAVFCIRNHADPRTAARFLKPNPKEVFADALGFVEDLEEKREDS